MPITPTTIEIVTTHEQVANLCGQGRRVQVPLKAPSDWDWYITTTSDEISTLLDEALEVGQSLVATVDRRYVYFEINDDLAQ